MAPLYDVITAAAALGEPVSFSTEDEDKRWLIHALSRSLAAEGISEDLIDTVEEIFTDRPDGAVPVRKLDGVLVRLGLPLPRRKRSTGVRPLTQEEAARITDRFRRATRQLMQVVPYRVAAYPTEELRRLLALRDEQPAPGDALSYLRRYALAISGLLDLMGDDE
ncbi:hypothetical protein [Streptomyces sp. NPDC015125]|uniref:hypothetical protein n=1 Tax=Streptomyces sp. NPDC015125 TaxID=3364938 RepID=UPI0036F86873